MNFLRLLLLCFAALVLAACGANPAATPTPAPEPSGDSFTFSYDPATGFSSASASELSAQLFEPNTFLKLSKFTYKLRDANTLDLSVAFKNVSGLKLMNNFAVHVEVLAGTPTVSSSRLYMTDLGNDGYLGLNEGTSTESFSISFTSAFSIRLRTDVNTNSYPTGYPRTNTSQGTMLQDASGNMYVEVSTEVETQNGNNINRVNTSFLYKLSAGGDVLWKVTFAERYILDMVLDGDGSVYLTHRAVNNSNASTIVRLQPNGTTVWATNVTGEVLSVAVDQANRVVAQLPIPEQILVFNKTTGSQVSSHLYDTNLGLRHFDDDIHIDATGIYLLTSNDTRLAVLVKYQLPGSGPLTPLWSKTLFPGEAVTGYRQRKASFDIKDGVIHTAASVRKEDDSGTNSALVLYAKLDRATGASLLATDYTTQVLDVAALSFSSSTNYVSSVSATGDGGAVMAGHFAFESFAINGEDFVIDSSTAMYVQKVDAQGQRQWARTFQFGNSPQATFYDGAIYAAGLQTDIYPHMHKVDNTALHFVKLDQVGELVP
jgi:hypothetical protein